jgi:hypothetical protein
MARLASLGRVSGKLQGRSGWRRRLGLSLCDAQQHNQREDAVQTSVAQQRLSVERPTEAGCGCKRQRQNGEASKRGFWNGCERRTGLGSKRPTSFHGSSLAHRPVHSCSTTTLTLPTLVCPLRQRPANCPRLGVEKHFCA